MYNDCNDLLQCQWLKYTETNDFYTVFSQN